MGIDKGIALGGGFGCLLGSGMIAGYGSELKEKVGVDPLKYFPLI